MSRVTQVLTFTLSDKSARQEQTIPKIPDTFSDVLQQTVEGISGNRREEFFDNYAISILERRSRCLIPDLREWVRRGRTV